MQKAFKIFVLSITVISCVAIIAFAFCCLAALGYNAQISVEKEKIEVVYSDTNSNPHN